ncbi:unnamed protein product, partial [Durusdinium trenchii]
LHVQEPSCRRGHVDPMRSVRRLRDLRRWAMFQRGCALAPSRAQRSRVVRCRRFLRHPVALGELLASLPLQPYTHEADDLGEDGEAVHCTKYVQTALESVRPGRPVCTSLRHAAQAYPATGCARGAPGR